MPVADGFSAVSGTTHTFLDRLRFMFQLQSDRRPDLFIGSNQLQTELVHQVSIVGFQLETSADFVASVDKTLAGIQ